MVDPDMKVLPWLTVFHALFAGYWLALIIDLEPTPLRWMGLIFNVWMLVAWSGVERNRRG